MEELALRPLAGREVRVQLRASGICRSDLSLRDGSIPSLLPSALGHEGAGIVTEVGDDVTTIKPGQHVVLTWIVSCRSCPHCLRGETQLCLHAYDHAYGARYAESATGPVWPGMGVGSLAEETLLPAAAVVPVDESLPLDHAALLGCGVTTGVGAVIRTAAVRPGDSVLVIGCGGVGSGRDPSRPGCLGRRASSPPIVWRPSFPPRWPTARPTPSTPVTSTSPPPCTTSPAAPVSIMESRWWANRPPSGRLMTPPVAAARSPWSEQPLHRRGDVSALSLMTDGKIMQGSVYGASDPPRDIPMLAGLAQRGQLDLKALVTRRIGIDDVEAAFTDMSAGRGARSVAVRLGH